MDIYANYKVFKTEFAGRPLVVETGKFAGLANGSCMIRYGDTCVLATATASAKPRDGIDFFPLAVDYEEKLYSVGKIPGGFLKREGKPSEKAILTSRVIDRPIRPLFPKDMRNDVVISTTPMAVNNDYSPEITAMNGASVAIAISDIPWNGPIAGVILGYVDGPYIYITGRKKNVIITKNGKNVFPEELEYYLGKVSLVSESMVWAAQDDSGQDDLIVATIKPDMEEVEAVIGKEAAEDPEKVEKLMWQEVDKINEDLPFFKKIRRINIRKEEFEKTTGKKIKRFVESNKQK